MLACYKSEYIYAEKHPIDDCRTADMAGIDYLDFELEIGKRVGREYAVPVLASPAGKPMKQCAFPLAT